MGTHSPTQGTIQQFARGVLVPVLFLTFALAFYFAAQDLPPRAFAFPFFCIVVIVIICLGIILRRGLTAVNRSRSSQRAMTSEDFDPLLSHSKTGSVRVVTAVATLLAYTVALGTFGYYPAAAAFAPLMVFVIGGRESWTRLVMAPIVGVTLSYLVFDLLLGVILP